MSFFNRNSLTQGLMLAAGLATLFSQPVAADDDHVSGKETAIIVFGVLGVLGICILPDLVTACLRKNSTVERSSLIRAEEGVAGGPTPTN